PLHITESRRISFHSVPRTPRSTLFPYTTLFRSREAQGERRHHAELPDREERDERERMHPGEVCLTVGDVHRAPEGAGGECGGDADRKSTRLNSSHVSISYAVFCLTEQASGYLGS